MSIRVGLVDDKRCELHVQNKEHEECPVRTYAIRKRLMSAGVYAKCELIKSLDIGDMELGMAHTQKYIKKVQRCCTNYGTALIDGPDVRVNGKGSLTAAIAAASGVISAVDEVVTHNNVDRVFCNVRPPGHHAHSNAAAGFCIFNNVVLGVKRAQKLGVEKILIIDFDLHHGDGTQSMVWNDQRVAYASLHRAPPFYPNGGWETQTGAHNNIWNYPQPKGVTSNEYMEDFSRLIKRAREFDPGLIFVSCGFDGHKDDLFSALPLDYDDYKKMTREICKLSVECCQGRIISVLEGGYTLNVLGRCVCEHIEVLLEN